MVLLLLVGGSVYFALRALDDGQRATAATSTPPPPPPLTLIAPESPITRAQRIDVTAVRPRGLRQDQEYVVRLYVNGEVVRERPLPVEEQFLLAAVPLAQGANSIRVSLSGAGGEGEKSPALSVTRDDVAPEVRVTQPAADARLYTAEVVLAGTTEPGASIEITAPDGSEVEATLSENGRFTAAVQLEVGANRYVLRSVDAAGNRSSARVTLIRASSEASLSLDVSPEAALTTDLPLRVTLSAVVRDELGRPADGAQVIFSVSPPNRETATYRLTTEDGRARWTELVIDRGETPGVWLITALATLPSGLELRQDGSFSLE